MEAKEKAWQLYNTYRTLEGKWGDKVLYNYDAKQCALIAVAEITSLMIKFHGRHINDNIMEIEYWEKVKTEIEKL